MASRPSSSHGTDNKQFRDPRKLSSEGQSLYQLLGIEKNAPPEDVRKAYRKLALRCHPDKNPDDPNAGEKFAEINRAHAILSDESKRAFYDKYGSFGLFMADQMGEENAELYLRLNNPCLRCLLVTCFILTGCCCCLCCCFCCSCCRTYKEETTPDPEDIVLIQPPRTPESYNVANASPSAVSPLQNGDGGSCLFERPEDEDVKKEEEAKVVTSQPEVIALPFTGDAYPSTAQQNGPSDNLTGNDPIGTYKSFGSSQNP
uniref:Cysteine string protein n=1 Tax=Schistocephalus solidus TaxID=70667 RepID=A0A0X3PDG7_SCHSO